ncbi:hypothetical protein NL676_015844 [Syzygium grande]|nr:hypothetical protein NL676_015844 [Syzygium grande]
MIARGDLGVEIPLEQIPTVQEEITYVCRQMNKPVIVASQLLESMVEFPTPTRAEVADVSEAVRQYADALMLSGESAIGSYGQKALSVLRMASSRMESWSRQENRQSTLFHCKLGTSLPDRIAEQICNCAAEMANNLGVDAIFVYTKHGHMASLLSRNRPYCPIFAFTNDKSTRMALNLQWGVIPLFIDLTDDMEANIARSVDLMKVKGLVREGDAVLVVSDVTPTGAPSTAFQSIQTLKNATASAKLTSLRASPGGKLHVAISLSRSAVAYAQPQNKARTLALAPVPPLNSASPRMRTETIHHVRVSSTTGSFVHLEEKIARPAFASSSVPRSKFSGSSRWCKESGPRRRVLRLMDCGYSRDGLKRRPFVSCKVQDGDGKSNGIGEEPPESLFMKELKRRGMTPTSLLEDTKKSSYDSGLEEERGFFEKKCSLY